MGSKYQLVPLAPACHQNLALLPSAEEDANTQIIPLHVPVSTSCSPAVFAECSPLWACCTFFGAWSYNLSHLNHAAERADEIIPPLSATAVNPWEEKQDLHGWINSSRSQATLPNIYSAKRFFFSLSCAPKGKTGHGYQKNERLSIYQLAKFVRQTYSSAAKTRFA